MSTPLSAYALLFLVLSLGLCSCTETDLEEVYGDEGSELTLPCKGGQSVSWRRPGRDDNIAERMTIADDNSLVLKNLSRHDAGVYTCAETDDNIMNRVLVRVRTPPPALSNVTVVPSTILALLHWEVSDTGGYPILYFTAQFRRRHHPPNQKHDPWHLVLPDKIKPAATQIDVYQLEPNSSYVFQVWATNKLGAGEVVEVEAMTKHDTQEIELAKHLLEGADTFDTRIWVAAVAVVMGTLLVLATATIYALYCQCHMPLVSDKDMETMELIPNIILNPGFHDFVQSDWSEPDENSNDFTAVRLNNNSVVNPIRI